jgi:hypothetical protein
MNRQSLNAGAAGFVLDRRRPRLNFGPSLIRTERTDGHRRGPPWGDHSGHRTPNQWIRQHDLDMMVSIASTDAIRHFLDNC